MTVLISTPLSTNTSTMAVWPSLDANEKPSTQPLTLILLKLDVALKFKVQILH